MRIECSNIQSSIERNRRIFPPSFCSEKPSMVTMR
jgi:hypothetical protein